MTRLPPSTLKQKVLWLRVCREALASIVAVRCWGLGRDVASVRRSFLYGGPVGGLTRGEGLGVDTSPLPWARWLARKSQGGR